MKKIIEWYRHHKRDLPWRNTRDPYKVWLSEIILQQTRVAQGLPYYQNFINAYPDVYSLANATEQEVLNLWQGLGYYSRARNLHFTAQTVVNQHNGVFPGSYKDLLKLKGVGEYTAAAIASFCYDEPVAVVDGNVYRVLSRLYGIETPINTTEGKKEFKALAQQNLDQNNPAIYNQAIMEFGALHCLPAGALCQTCPVQTGCVAYQTGKVAVLPVKLSKSKIKKRYLHYIAVLHDNSIILQQRKGKGIWQNLYQLPLIETEKKQSLKPEFIQKQLQKQQIHITKKLTHITHTVHKLTHRHLYIDFWIAQAERKTDFFVPFQQVKNYPMPIVIANFLENNIL